MTTEAELNEKLAKFAGWTPIHDNKKVVRQWANSNNVRFMTPPDVTHDIKACLEYLGPKFGTWLMNYGFSTPRRYTVQVYLNFEKGNWTDDNSALAFCRAAEQAIDKLDADYPNATFEEKE